MKFSDLIRGRDDMIRSDSEDFEVKGLTYDSRNVKPGYIFFAIKGLKEDGNKYIMDAIKNGASMIVSEEKIDMKHNLNFRSVDDIRKTMALWSSTFFGYPSEKLKLIGVTGTNGKTTTSYLIRSFLSDAGYKTGIIGTIGYETGSRKVNSTLTTPDSVELNMMLSEMVNSDVKYCVMEVSSIALAMDRAYSLKFDAAVFTNLTSEHLDFHENMENYFNAKRILFDNLSPGSKAISNKDDEYGEAILHDSEAEKFFYSVKEESNLRSYNESLTLDGLEFDVDWNNKSYRLRSKLTGRFNIYNILASVSVMLHYDMDMETIQKSLLNFSEVSGRFNRVKLPNGAIAVIDYSHTSDSLKNAIDSAREIVNEENRSGRVITIFGCGGNRDRTKRSVMGEFAASLSDHAIVTSDNPRFEDPMEIIDEIVKGMKSKNYEIIENREEAIKRGIEMSRENDILLICGKGHETYQEIEGNRSHFDDKEMVEKFFQYAK